MIAIIILIFILIILLAFFWQDIQSRRKVSKYLSERLELEKPSQTYIVIDRPRQNVYNDSIKERNLKLEIETRRNLAIEEKKKELLKKQGVKL